MSIAKIKQELSFWLLSLIVIYLTFEDFFLKWIPVPDLVITAMRGVPELIVYILFLDVFKKVILRKKKFQKTPLEPLVVAFIIWSFILTILTKSSIFSTLITLRPLLRFIAVYYVVVYLNVSKNQLNIILKIIIFSAFLESIIAILQYFFNPLNSFFSARSLNVDILDYQRVTSISQNIAQGGASFGTFSDPGILSIYLFIPFVLLSTCIILSFSQVENNFFISNKLSILLICTLLFAMFTTTKRAVIFIVFFSFIFSFLNLKMYRKLRWIIWLFSCGVYLIILLYLLLDLNRTILVDWEETKKADQIDMFSYMTSIFSQEYLQSAETSRLLYARLLCGRVITTGYWYGLSPDSDVMINQAASLAPNSAMKTLWLKDAPLSIYEDVYWCSMIAYYGIPGVIIYIVILLQLYKVSKLVFLFYPSIEYKLLGLSLCNIIMLTFVYTWIERIPVARNFTFCFWFLAGLSMNYYIKFKKQN